MCVFEYRSINTRILPRVTQIGSAICLHHFVLHNMLDDVGNCIQADCIEDVCCTFIDFCIQVAIEDGKHLLWVAHEPQDT